MTNLTKRLEMREKMRKSRIEMAEDAANRARKQQRKERLLAIAFFLALACIYIPILALITYGVHLLIGWTAAIIGVTIIGLGMLLLILTVIKIMNS